MPHATAAPLGTLTRMDDTLTCLHTDLAVAGQVHRSLIPTNYVQGALEVATEFHPMMGIGGDYANIHYQTDRQIIASVCDVSGHGIAAALLASRVNSFILSLAPRAKHPCQVVEELNEFVYTHFENTGLFLSFFCLFIDLDKRSLLHSGCGHPPVLHYSKRAGRIARLESENTLIGLFPDLSRTCSMLRHPFEPGDRLLLYTDGLIESRNRAGIMLNIDGLESLADKHYKLDGLSANRAIMRDIALFRQTRPADDDQLLLSLSFLDDAGQRTSR